MKKIVSFLLAAAMAASLLTACSGDTPAASSGGASQGGETSQSEGQDSGEEAENVTIRIMSWHGEQSESLFYKGYKEAADAYTAEHPNVTFEFIFQPLDGYQQLLDTQFIANSAPEIIHMQPGLNADYANRGVLYDLTNALNTKSAYAEEEKWIDTFKGGSDSFATARSSNMFGGIFFIPNDEDPTLAIGQPFAYNKDMFEAAGLDPEDTPETWSEFIDICETLKQSGVIPFSADNDRWVGWSLGNIGGQFGEHYVDQYFDDKYNGEDSDALFSDKCYIALANGEALTPDYNADVMRLWKEFSQYWQDGWTGTSYDESANLFFMQEAAMMQIGSWDHTNFKDTIGSTFEWGVFPVPLVDEESSQYASGKYGAASGQQNYGFAVNKNIEGSGYLETAVIDFLQYFSSADVQSQYCATALSYSPVVGAEIPEELMAYANPVTDEPATQMFAVRYIEWGDAAIWKGYAQDYLTGNLDEATFNQNVADLTQKACQDYCNELLKPEGYAQQIADAEAKLEEMKADGAAEAALEAQQETVDNLKLRQELMNNTLKQQ